MLPGSLYGPRKTIDFESPDAFLRSNAQQYPNLDPDFILQICFEHPDQLDFLLPGFDPKLHSAIRIKKTLGWLYDNVRYLNNKELTFWYEQFDRFRETSETSYEIYAYMAKTGTWPFPPVIIETMFAASLGATEELGNPFHLIEGTHRMSYARRMLELGLVDTSRVVEVIEIKGTI